MGGKKPTIGYQYFMGMHVVVCQGDGAEVIKVDMGNREVWSGNVSTNSRVYWDKPNLFGGKKKEGGVQGYVDYMFGAQDQPQNSYLQSKIRPDIPAYRRVLSLVLNKCYLASMSPYLKPMKVWVRRFHKDWYAEKAVVNTHHSNPAHIIHECITNNDWGMGWSSSIIDDTSFRACADTLYAEGMGLSLVWRREAPIEDFLGMVLDHINATIYIDPATGTFKLKLIRDDYVVEDLPVFDESNIIRLNSYERPSMSETVNELSVKYADGNDDEQVVTVHNLANVQAQGAIVSQTREYPGIPTSELATRVALRDLRSLSSALAKIQIVCNRDAWDLGIGDPFVFSWPVHGIQSLVMRVINIQMQGDREGNFYLDAMEDVFGLPAAGYLGTQGSDWVDPVGDAQVVQHLALLEVPYGELARRYDPEDFANITSTSSQVAVLAAKNTGSDLNVSLHSGANIGAETNDDDENIEHAPWGRLSVGIDQANTSIELSSNVGFDFLLELPIAAVIGDEIVEITAIDNLTLTVVRGVFDSVPEVHAAGESIFALDYADAYEDEERAKGETVWYRPVNVNGVGVSSWAASPSVSIAIDARQDKPYVPGNVKVNGEWWPSTVIDDIAITWSNRDRDTPGQPINWYDASDNPEAGVTVTVTLRKQSDNSVVHQETGITGNSFTYTLVDELIENGVYTAAFILEISAERGGLESHFTFRHQFVRTFTSTGEGLDLTTADDGQAIFDLLNGV